MVKITSLCTDCVQIITNPICPNCFSKQVIAWLRDKKVSEEKMKKMQELFRKLIMNTEEAPSDIRCILCDCKKVNLCVYCFTNRAYRILDQNTSEKTKGEFKEDFNTKIWRI